jgi:predicted GNAT family acetyltransferase
MLRIQRFSDASAFRSALSPLEIAHEFKYSLFFGVLDRLTKDPSFCSHPHMAACFSGDELVAALLRTPPFRCLALCEDETRLHEALDQLAQDLSPDAFGVVAPSNVAALFANSFSARHAASARVIMNERLFKCDANTFAWPPRACNGRYRIAVPEDLDCLVPMFISFQEEAAPDEPKIPIEHKRAGILQRIEQNDIFLWINDAGEIVSFVSKGRRTENTCSIGPVYTPKAHRGCGYASWLTAQTTASVLHSKPFAVLFTDLKNPTSNSVYMKIGYRPICDYDMYQFERA